MVDDARAAQLEKRLMVVPSRYVRPRRRVGHVVSVIDRGSWDSAWIYKLLCDHCLQYWDEANDADGDCTWDTLNRRIRSIVW